MINTAENNPSLPAARLSIRVSEVNPRHHLWNNNGTWWIHFTEHLADFTKRRIRRSLRTSDELEAVRRRDQLLGQLSLSP